MKLSTYAGRLFNRLSVCVCNWLLEAYRASQQADTLSVPRDSPLYCDDLTIWHTGIHVCRVDLSTEYVMHVPLV